MGAPTRRDDEFTATSSASSSFVAAPFSDQNTTTALASNAVTPAAEKAAPASSAGGQEEVTALQDFIAGGIAGSASILVGHPFDTIKVRLQTSASSGSTSLLSMASSFGGLSSLFSGLGAPLASAAVVNAIIFSSYGASSRWYDNYFNSQAASYNQEEKKPVHDPWQKAMLCGSFAGWVQCIVICPTEHLKCRLQVQHAAPALDHVFDGPLHAAKQIIREHGFFKGFYRGWNVTCVREVPSFGVYFTVYDSLKDRVINFLAEQAQKRQNSFLQHDHAQLLIASTLSGGIAGCTTWGLVYPTDVIKTRIQTSPLSSKAPHHRHIIPAGRAIVEQHGWRALWRGLGITLIRAFPVNATVFPVYEFMLLHISQLQYGD